MNSLVNFSRRRVDDPLARELRDDLVADGVHQVGLAEADPAVQEERVVGVARALRHRQARRVGEAVGRPDDEVRERVAGVDVARRRPRRRRGRARPGPAAPAGAPGRRVVRPRRTRADRDRAATIAVRRFPLCGFGRRRCVIRGLLARRVDRTDHELHLDAVADDTAQRLRDQRAVPAFQPVLGEAVRDRDPEAVVIDLDERGVAQPGLEVRRREGDLELAKGCAPDLLRVHRSMWTLVFRGRGDGCRGAQGNATDGSARGGNAGRRGFGWRNIAPPPGSRKANPRYSPGVSGLGLGGAPSVPRGGLRLTVRRRATYHPPDVDAPHPCTG